MLNVTSERGHELLTPRERWRWLVGPDLIIRGPRVCFNIEYMALSWRQFESDINDEVSEQ
jgi:hypothetical protein